MVQYGWFSRESNRFETSDFKTLLTGADVSWISVQCYGITKGFTLEKVIRFRKNGKLGPQYFGLFLVIARVDKVACRLELAEELSQIHITFHVVKL